MISKEKKSTVEGVKQVLKNPSKSVEIQKGRKYESRLRLFTESMMVEDIRLETANTEFQNKLKNILTPKKYKRIQDFIEYPLPVVDVTESIHSELLRVFDSRNSYFSNDYNRIAVSKTIEPKLSDLDARCFIEKNGANALKNAPNQIAVIDKDKEGKMYLVSVGIDRLIDYKLNEDFTTFEYIVFEHGEPNHVCFYDKDFYRVFEKTKNDEYILITEEAHTAGVCPARMFFSKRLNKKNDLLRLNPFTNVISKLTQWQTFDVYQYYADHYAPWPIIERPEEKCEDVTCIGGYIEQRYPSDERDEDGGVIYGTVKVECEKCKNRGITGPGTVVTIPPQFEKDDPTEKGTTRIVTTSTETLEYTQKKCNILEEYIRMKVVGKKSLIDKEAVNETQVQGSFEDQKQVLIKWKTEFDELYKWIVETAIYLVDPKIEVEVSANFGTEFYLNSVEDLMMRYKLAKDNNLPEEEQDSIYREMIETKYKGNKAKLDRAIVINAIDPYPYLSVQQVSDFNQRAIISNEDLALKLNVTKFIQRFELQNGSISEFGITLKPWDRIVKIREVINQYIKEYEQNKPKQPEQSIEGVK